jgi:hypothetical protein
MIHINTYTCLKTCCVLPTAGALNASMPILAYNGTGPMPHPCPGMDGSEGPGGPHGGPHGGAFDGPGGFRMAPPGAFVLAACFRLVVCLCAHGSVLSLLP